MRILPPVQPTAEQLKILADNKAGFTLIKGAAGSGKTTTALLRLRQLCESWLARRERLDLTAPVRVLVLTYNRTLEGYITELARQQIAGRTGLQLEVMTLSKWAIGLMGGTDVLDRKDSEKLLRPYLRNVRGDENFLLEEIDYLLGRFEPNDLGSYLTARRDGRGITPRIETPTKRQLLDEVIAPYTQDKLRLDVLDWNDVAVAAKMIQDVPPWDVVILDEAQDFSANQVRAVLAHLSDPFSVTFVMDAVQRIYPRYFAWKEVGITRFENIYTLKRNYRNTKQIAAFARPLVEGLPAENDGAIPDFDACTKDGPLPLVVSGKYSDQIDYILNRLLGTVDFGNESVAFLQTRGYGWFDALRARLRSGGLPFAELTRASRWPTGAESIALCTMHSAKGLEFDHVVMPGLNAEVTPHGNDEGDVQLDNLRRLIAMGVGRARKSVIIGYKPSDPSRVLGLLKPETYELVTL
ncbi:3'-5' exonuclease [Planotetraspora phitsanulokensis]|uniref:DNA 3'-5' helicase n=1 Tax=Planotetraspora phitsanulokensis TaxID=575192 RepID=A0A8J3U950_9ACTN|nr:3'-5' exonuclease [Planotetraspora phitsanulokensis]GII40346.1 DNA helicase [Planotetraspora phitsanulokensis]